MIFIKVSRGKNAIAVITKKAGMIAFYSITTCHASHSSVCMQQYSAKNAICQMNTPTPNRTVMFAMPMMMSIKPGWAPIAHLATTRTHGTCGCLIMIKPALSKLMAHTKNSDVTTVTRQHPETNRKHQQTVSPVTVAVTFTTGYLADNAAIATAPKVLKISTSNVKADRHGLPE